MLFGASARLAKDLGVPVPRPFAAMREQIENFSELSDAQLENQFDEILRPYQKDGVKWMNFIRTMQWGGCCRRHGLGKTVQTIAAMEHGSS